MTSPQRSFYFYIAFQKNSKIMYKQIIRPLLFLMDPEKAHSLLVSCLKRLPASALVQVLGASFLRLSR